jgi:hypothetical protein
MGKRRGRRTRSDSGGRRLDIENGFPTFEHNQWTFEGYLERWGAFHRGLSQRRDSGRPMPGAAELVVPILVTAALLALLVLAVGALLILAF